MQENDLSNCVQLDFVEGTMVVFWDKTADEWNINTKGVLVLDVVGIATKH